MPCFIDRRTWRASKGGLLKIGVLFRNVTNGEVGYSYQLERLAYKAELVGGVYGEAKWMASLLPSAL